MKTFCLKSITAVLLLLILFTAGDPSSMAAESTTGGKSLVIGLLPEMNVFRQKRRFDALAAYLSQRMGIEVRLTILSIYGNIIDRIKHEAVDGAFLGSFTGALAISQLDVLPLVRPINMDGTSTYYGLIFVRRDSNIRTAADMKGKTLALVEKATTAGYVFPLAWFKQQGIDNFSTYFSEYFFTGSHDGAIDAVLNKTADVGAAKNTVYELIEKTNPRIAEELMVLANSPRVPSNALCVRKGLDQKYVKQLKDLLLNLHLDPGGLEVLRQLGAKRFVETGSEDYLPVFELANEAGIDINSYSYHNH